MKSYKYYICDVFTDSRFSGNQLAVIPKASGLNDKQMQKIAREFNFSETTFVFPTDSSFNRNVRIFTPYEELPFAGHPNIGTAFILANDPDSKDIRAPAILKFDELAGPVEVKIFYDEKNALTCELKAPERFSFGKSVSVSEIAEILSLDESDINVNTHMPIEASVGLKFTIINLNSIDALRRVSINPLKLNALKDFEVSTSVHCYYLDKNTQSINARMFAPDLGVREDPATGSANCALAGLLGHLEEIEAGAFSWAINQGIEMGRPSRLNARVLKAGGEVTDVWIAGNSILVSEGEIFLD